MKRNKSEVLAYWNRVIRLNGVQGMNTISLLWYTYIRNREIIKYKNKAD